MKKLLVLCLSCTALISSFTFNVLAQTNYESAFSSSSNSIEPRSDILEWVFKTFNGKQYRRLWNATQGRWVTDWLPV